jgi:hypothetical protein
MAINLAALAAMPVTDAVNVVVVVLPLTPWPLGTATARAATVAARAAAAIAPSAPVAITSSVVRAATIAREAAALPTATTTASSAIAQEVDERVDVDRPWHRGPGHAAAGPLLCRVMVTQ